MTWTVFLSLVSISIINKFPGITTYLFNAGAYFKSARWVFIGGRGRRARDSLRKRRQAMLFQTYKPPKTSRCGMRGAFRKHLEGDFST